MKSTFAGSGVARLREAVRSVEESFLQRTDTGPILRVMSTDPGKITGVSVFWYGRQKGRWVAFAWAETLLAGDENKQVRDLVSLAQILLDCGPTDFVIEDFRVLKISMEASFLSPVRIGRKFEWELVRDPSFWFHAFAVQFVFSAEMASMLDPRLKALGFFTPGPDHRRDATRHNLLHSRSLNNGSVKRNSVEQIALKRFSGGQPFRKSPSLRGGPVRPAAGVSLRKKVRRRVSL